MFTLGKFHHNLSSVYRNGIKARADPQKNNVHHRGKPDCNLLIERGAHANSSFDGVLAGEVIQEDPDDPVAVMQRLKTEDS